MMNFHPGWSVVCLGTRRASVLCSPADTMQEATRGSIISTEPIWADYGLKINPEFIPAADGLFRRLVPFHGQQHYIVPVTDALIAAIRSHHTAPHTSGDSGGQRAGSFRVLRLPYAITSQASACPTWESHRKRRPLPRSKCENIIFTDYDFYSAASTTTALFKRITAVNHLGFWGANDSVLHLSCCRQGGYRGLTFSIFNLFA